MESWLVLRERGREGGSGGEREGGSRGGRGREGGQEVGGGGKEGQEVGGGGKGVRKAALVRALEEAWEGGVVAPTPGGLSLLCPHCITSPSHWDRVTLEVR